MVVVVLGIHSTLGRGTIGKAASFLETFPFPPNTVNPPDFASHLHLAREASKSGLWSDFRDIDLFGPVSRYRGG